jgi:hypothetical protein
MRFHRSTVVGMAAAALLALALLGPIAFAVLTMRSTPRSGGASVGAGLVITLVLLLAAVVAAAAGGAAVSAGRRIAERLGARRPGS